MRSPLEGGGVPCLLGNNRQSQNQRRGGPDFISRLLQYLPWREFSLKCLFRKFSRFSNFKGQLQAALGGSREFCDLIK